MTREGFLLQYEQHLTLWKYFCLKQSQYCTYSIRIKAIHMLEHVYLKQKPKSSPSWNKNITSCHFLKFWEIKWNLNLSLNWFNMKASFFIIACLGFLAEEEITVPKLPWVTPSEQSCIENKAKNNIYLVSYRSNQPMCLALCWDFEKRIVLHLT